MELQEILKNVDHLLQLIGGKWNIPVEERNLVVDQIITLIRSPLQKLIDSDPFQSSSDAIRAAAYAEGLECVIDKLIDALKEKG